jgi:fucose permease
MNNQKGISHSLLLIIISYLAFISLGLPDGLLGIAWPFLSERHSVPLDSLGILLISFVAGYLATSTTSGKIVTIIPLGVLLALSCSITGLSLLAYAFSNYWFLVVMASFFLGSGGGAIDASINIFAASRFTPSTINWLHGFYGLGATTGPIIMTWIFVQGQQWFYGYIIVGVVQIGLSIIFLGTLKYWKVSGENEEQHLPGSFAETFRLPMVWVSIFIFFIYTGLEIGVGQWIFTILTKSRSIDEKNAGLWTSAYWGSFTAGRIVFGFILTRLSVHKVLIGAMIGIVGGTILLAINQGPFLSLSGLILIGISNAPVFPCLISNTPIMVGKKHAANVIGFQISAAMIGGALLPGFAGLLTDHFGLEIIPITFFIEALLLMLLYIVSSRKQPKVAV